MEWVFINDLPIYSQLVEKLKTDIVSGALPPGTRLASVRDLAMEAGVNPNTMQRALQELEREGLVYSQRTSGRFVTEDYKVIEESKRVLAATRIESFIKSMKELGYEREAIIELLKEAE